MSKEGFGAIAAAFAGIVIGYYLTALIYERIYKKFVEKKR